MLTTFQMYWLVMLDSLSIAGAMLTLIFFVTTIVLYRAAVVENEIPSWPFKLTGALALLFLLVTTFLPSTKQMAAIILVPKIVNSEKMQTVGDNLYTLVVEWAKEIGPKKAK